MPASKTARLARPPGRSALLVAALSALALEGCAPDPGPRAGLWSGDLTLPDRLPTSVTWTVTRDEGGGTSVVLRYPLMPATSPAAIRSDGDTLAFALPKPFGRSCRATRRTHGEWRGSCLPAAGAGPGWRILMVAPGSGEPVGVARLAAERAGYEWRADRAGAAIVYTRPGTAARRHLARVMREAREAVLNAVRTLGEPGFAGPVRLYYLESRAQMDSLVGRPVRGWTDAGARAALLVTDSAGGSPVFHEVAHVVSIGRWGYLPPAGGWLQEGLAEWVAGGTCGSVPWGSFELRLERRGEALTLGQVTDEYWSHPDRKTLPAAASLVAFAARTGGLAAVRRLWEKAIAGTGPELPGVPPDSLESRWRADLRKRYEPVGEETYAATLGRPDGCPWPRPPSGEEGRPRRVRREPAGGEMDWRAESMVGAPSSMRETSCALG